MTQHPAEAEDTAVAPAADPASIRRAVMAGGVGSVLEWYDFFAYGTAASLVFGHVFFPNISSAGGTLAAFATYGVGFFARPVGGLVFSHFGDRIGRKMILIITLIMMGVATTLIGLLPSYESIGIAAPILLVVLRLVQGFAAGGELGGAIVLALEYSGPRKRGFNTSWMACGVIGGLLLSSAVFTVCTAVFSETAFQEYGWRIPFVVSILLVATGMYVRLKVEESPLFNEVRKSGNQVRVPVVEVVRTHKRSLLVVMGARLIDNGVFFIYSVYLLNYAKEATDLSSTAALIALSLACVVALVLVPWFASLSDRYGRRPVFMAGAGFSILAAFPIFAMATTGNPLLFGLALILGIAVGWGMVTAVVGAYFAELFPARLRYSGITLGREISSIFAGGLSPFIAAALLTTTGSIWPVAGYAILLSAVSLIAVYYGPETYRLESLR
ncbi:MFS transporter [Nonomuraea rhizosphaerae]|uniref:MFS transporter n=1 Tax=Nonomuraea rhizosphaerae TaxID=2665663 RepID=UPI001C5DDD20|nr:MFS transporter [Nonomuraea rhizosphaerae]